MLEVAEKQIGTKESPANSNNVKYNTWFYGHAVSGSAYPWCMAFVEWCFSEAGMPLPFLTASCGSLLNWYKKNDPDCIVITPQLGDIAIFNWPGTKYTTDHTGIVRSVGKRQITTIEGNTSLGNDSNGGMVMRRVRDRQYVNAYIRPRCLRVEMEDDDIMTGEEIYKALTAYLAGLPASDYAKESCKRAVECGVFKDGDGDGMIDAPRGLLSREDAAVLFERLGLLDT